MLLVAMAFAPSIFLLLDIVDKPRDNISPLFSFQPTLGGHVSPGQLLLHVMRCLTTAFWEPSLMTVPNRYFSVCIRATHGHPSAHQLQHLHVVHRITQGHGLGGIRVQSGEEMLDTRTWPRGCHSDGAPAICDWRCRSLTKVVT